ncbi:MAG TPA: hypothetical protein VFN62_00020, partial [Acidobacteriaceae bacterium]|nr:hypothetical protein [Acidobacteriaceae bacterium]
MQLSPSLAQTIANLHLPPYPSVTGLPQPITLRSLALFAGALVWAWILLVSFTGWGRFTGKLFRADPLPASIACSLGIAVVIFIGGVLNLAHAIFAAVVFASVAIGLLFYLASLRQRPADYRWNNFWRRAAPWARLLMISVLIILAFRAAATVRLSVFDAIDDGPAYLVFPGAMLAHHHFFTGPFSDRHIISSVGGGYWLQTFVIAATSLAHIGMVDRTLGLILLAAMVWDLGVLFQLGTTQIAVVEFLVYLVPQQTANLTFVILPTVLLLALLWFVYRTVPEQEHGLWRYALLAGAVGGAAVALKSTFLPCVGSFCLFPYLVLYWRDKKKAVALPIVAGLGALLVLALWMIDLKHAVGTYLYPILGRGIDYSSYGLFRSFAIAKTPRTIVKLFLQAIPLLGLSFLALAFGRSRRLLFCFGVMVAAAFGITAFNIAAGGDSIWRYGFPQFFSAIVIYSIALAAASKDEFRVRRRVLESSIAMISLAACVFYYDVSGRNPRLFSQALWESAHYGAALRASLSGRHLSDLVTVAEYRGMETALPAQNVVLEDVAYPFLLNQKTHTVYQMDWPGAAGPAPGWPFTNNTAVLAQYLRKNSVRYIAFDYEYARWIDISSCAVLERPKYYST